MPGIVEVCIDPSDLDDNMLLVQVGGRKVDARIELGADKSEAMLGRKKTHGKENIEQNVNAIRLVCGVNTKQACVEAEKSTI